MRTRAEVPETQNAIVKDDSLRIRVKLGVVNEYVIANQSQDGIDRGRGHIKTPNPFQPRLKLLAHLKFRDGYIDAAPVPAPVAQSVDSMWMQIKVHVATDEMSPSAIRMIENCRAVLILVWLHG